MAKRKTALAADHPAAEIVQAVADSTQMPDTSFDTATLERQAPAEEKKYTRNPRPYGGLDLGNGEEMQLWRDDRKGEIAITFSHKPEPQFIQMTKDEGFHRNSEGTAWVVKMDPDAKWRAAAKAERAFTKIGNAIREGRGLEPSQVMTLG